MATAQQICDAICFGVGFAGGLHDNCEQACFAAGGLLGSADPPMPYGFKHYPPCCRSVNVITGFSAPDKNGVYFA
jgi:hypothetical protein